MPRAIRSIFLGVAVLCLMSGPLSAGSSKKKPRPAPKGSSTAFPAAGIDQIDHDLQIELYQRGSEGAPDRLLETLSFSGRMMIERGDPYTNASGNRAIPFVVTRWEATAWSNSLGSLVVYRLSDAPQPMSHITAQTKNADYPAAFSFALLFDARAYGQILIERHEGRPEGHGFREVPPSGNRLTSPTITSFERRVIEGDHPQLGRIYFKPKNCNDQNSKTLHTYTAQEKASLKLPQGR